VPAHAAGPIEEIFSDAGLYFNSEDAASIAKALRSFIEDAGLLARCA
jgi:hypothetical protein